MGRPKLIGSKDRLIPPESRDVVLEFLDTNRAGYEVPRMAILLADQAGLRISEMCKLRAADCDIQRTPYRLLIRGAKHRTADHVDEQPIGEELAAELRTWITDYDIAADATILKGDVTPYTRQHVLSLIKEVHRECGLPEIYNAHAWRHGYGTRVYLQTRDLVLTSRMLRHRSTKPTEKYVHMATAMAEMGEVLAAVAATSTPPKKSTKKSQKKPQTKSQRPAGRKRSR